MVEDDRKAAVRRRNNCAQSPDISRGGEIHVVDVVFKRAEDDTATGW
jgi:hypothetical protein